MFINFRRVTILLYVVDGAVSVPCSLIKTLAGSTFPSVISTFLATLNIIPMDTQVNKKELPPILTKGSVTPVTGTMFTETAILAKA